MGWSQTHGHEEALQGVGMGPVSTGETPNGSIARAPEVVGAARTTLVRREVWFGASLASAYCAGGALVPIPGRGPPFRRGPPACRAESAEPQDEPGDTVVEPG